MSEAAAVEITKEKPKRESKQLALANPVPATPMSLIQLAVSQNADIEKLEKLMQLQMRWEENEARKAFVVAMNAFKTNPPEIAKNKKVSYGTGDKAVGYDYATLDQVCTQVTRGLSEHGITHRWKIQQQDGRIRVTCILTHAAGHSEETTLEGSADTSGAKNSIQAIGSSVTYLERYSLLAATGLAVKNADNDGAGTWESLPFALEEIKASGNLEDLNSVYKRWFKEATTAKNFQAMQAIVSCKDECKATLLKMEPAQ